MLSRLLTHRMRIISSLLARNFTALEHESPELSYTNYESSRAPPKDPPLLILHGLFGSKRNWESMGKAFATSGRRVITVDARNHGESSHVCGMDYHSMAQDIERLLYKLDIHKVILLGHSMGGKTAMCLAVTRPHLVEKLIVEDVAPDTNRTSLVTIFPQYITAMKEVHFDENVETLTQARKMASEQLETIFPDRGIRAFIVSNLRRGTTGFEWRVNLDAIERNLDYIVGFPTLTGKYLGDTLFIGGSKSEHISSKHEPAIKSLFPNATMDVINGAGHWVHAEKPQDFLYTVKQFIGDIER